MLCTYNDFFWSIPRRTSRLFSSQKGETVLLNIPYEKEHSVNILYRRQKNKYWLSGIAVRKEREGPT